MAYADSPCFGCSSYDYDYQYGEGWCNSSFCPHGVKNRRVNYQQEERGSLMN